MVTVIADCGCRLIHKSDCGDGRDVMILQPAGEEHRCDEEFLHQQQITHTERYNIFYDGQYFHYLNNNFH